MSVQPKIQTPYQPNPTMATHPPNANVPLVLVSCLQKVTNPARPIFNLLPNSSPWSPNNSSGWVAWSSESKWITPYAYYTFAGWSSGLPRPSFILADWAGWLAGFVSADCSSFIPDKTRLLMVYMVCSAEFRPVSIPTSIYLYQPTYIHLILILILLPHVLYFVLIYLSHLIPEQQQQQQTVT